MNALIGFLLSTNILETLVNYLILRNIWVILTDIVQQNAICGW